MTRDEYEIEIYGDMLEDYLDGCEPDWYNEDEDEGESWIDYPYESEYDYDWWDE